MTLEIQPEPAKSKLALRVNGRFVETAAETLEGLVAEHAGAGQRVATAVNGRFVAEPARATTALAAGDAIEIVSARQGG